jgi:3-hydroxy-9,10-secoandrosta-1,3,5(10)-triene-9,17-dione monooxygenase
MDTLRKGATAPGDDTLVGTLPQTVRRNFANIDLEEAVARAREIVPILRERAAQTEDARVMLRENEQLLHETGLFRFMQPKAFCGMELDFVSIVDVPAELARGCPSTAWNVCNYACHHWMLAFFDPEAQREVWEENPDALIASSFALATGTAKKTEGGFIINGRSPFSSGVDNADWNLIVMSVLDDDSGAPVDWRLCLVPRSDYEIIDTWQSMGMAGTGSNDIAFSDVFVPERRALPLLRAKGGHDHPGGKQNCAPVYGVPIVASAGTVLAAAAVGAAEGAYEIFVDSMAKRKGTYTGAQVADFQAVQTKVGRARCLIDSARMMLRDTAVGFSDIAARGEAPDLDTKLKYRAYAAFAVNQSREAIEALWSCYGAQGLYTRDPLQRHLRDVQAINQHFSYNFDIAGSAFGINALGGTYGNPTM